MTNQAPVRHPPEPGHSENECVKVNRAQYQGTGRPVDGGKERTGRPKPPAISTASARPLIATLGRSCLRYRALLQERNLVDFAHLQLWAEQVLRKADKQPVRETGLVAVEGIMERSIRPAERSMSKTYLPYDPDQQLLLPAALQEWLPSDHLAYFISDVVDHLDLSAITARYEEERRGGPPYHPRMMVKVLLYGYCNGVASSRRIARRLHEDIAFRVLAANNTPDFRTISDFRKDHLEALADLFLQVLELCQQAGLVKLGHVALDGTKVRANASKHKAMSYGRMKEREGQLSAEVAELLRRAGEVDDDEDRRYGEDKRGDELPEELAFRESRLRKIREAKAALEAGPWQMRSRQRWRVKSIPVYRTTRRSGTSPIPTPASCPALEGGTSSSPTTARRWWTTPTR